MRGTRRSTAGFVRAVCSVVTVVALAVSALVLGPVPKAVAAAGEETVWIGPLAGGTWMDSSNWSNGRPSAGSIAVFETPAQVDATKNYGAAGFGFDFRAGSDGARLSATSEYRPGWIRVAEGVAVELGLRLLRNEAAPTLRIAMSDHSTLKLTRQVQPTVIVESTKLVDGAGPQQADLENAVIRVASGDWETAPFQLSGNVRLELDKAIGGNVYPVHTPTPSQEATASPTAGQVVWIRDEQLFPDAVLDLREGLSADLNGRTQTVRGVTLSEGTALLGDAGLLRLDTGSVGDQHAEIAATGAAQSRIAGGALAVVGSGGATVRVDDGALQIQSKLTGSADLRVALDGGSLVLDDACGYVGTVTLTGSGTVTATSGIGGTVVLDGEVDFVDQSLGECVSATVPPGPPTHVRAQALVDRIGATLAWQWPLVTGTNPIARFEVYRSVDPLALGEKIADVPADAANVFEYVDEWASDEYLEGWTTYYYRVRAASAFTLGEPSAQVSVVTLGEPLAPASVTVLNGSGKVKLTWSRSVSTNVDAYRIYRSTQYNAPTLDDPWAGADPLPWSEPFGTESGQWELVGEVAPAQLEYLDDLATVVQDAADPVSDPRFPLERTWNYYVTAFSHDFGESAPNAVVAGTPSSRVELTMSIAQERTAYPGASAVFVADVSNLGESATSGDLTARMLVPAAYPVRVIDPGTGAWVPVTSATQSDGDGDGDADWTCSASSIGANTMLRCGYTSTLPGMTTSTALVFALDIPADAALGTVPISYAVSGSTAAGALGSGTNKPFVFDVEAITRAALEATATFDGALSADPAKPALIALSVANTGAAMTLESPTATIRVPEGSRLGAGHGTDAWTCAQPAPGADITCVSSADHLLGGVLLPGAVAPELVIPLVTPEAPWHAAEDLSRSIGITVAAADAYGTVSTQVAVSGTMRAAEAPALLASIESRNLVTQVPGTSAFRVVVTNAGGASRVAPLVLALRLPDGVVVDQSAVPSGWVCPQTGSTVECTSTAGHELAGGQVIAGPLLRTTVMDASATAAGQWLLSAHAAHDGIVSAPVDGVIEIAPLPPPPVSSLTIQPEHAPLLGGQRSSVSVTLAGPSATGPAPARSFAALLPSAVDAATVRVSLDGFGTMSPDTWGECRILDADAGPFPGAGDAIVCATATPTPRGASVVVEVDFTARALIEGTLDFAAGFLEASDSAAAVEALRAAGRGALLSPSTAAVEGVAFRVDAGPPQSASATVLTHDASGEPEVVPTTVTLAGSVSGGLGTPIAYCWVQVGGPEVSWVAPGAGTAPGTPGAAGLPSFPSSAEVPARCQPGGFSAASDHWFGAGASFLAPQSRDGAEVRLRLFATDGTVVADAGTTVTVESAGNAAPVIDEVTVLVRDGADWVAVPDLAAPQAAGTRLRLRVQVSDADGDRVTVSPWLIAPRSAGVTFAPAAESTATEQLFEFTWPTHVAQLDIGITAADGLTSLHGIPSTHTASLTLGPTPGQVIEPWAPITGDFEPITQPWRVARGLDLQGWSANGPIDPAAGVFAIGADIQHHDPDAAWRPGPLELTELRLRVLGSAPAWCTVDAAAASSGAPILGFTGTANIDWDGRDLVTSDFEFAVEGCIVPGAGWTIKNAHAITRMDIAQVPNTLTFRNVSFLARGTADGDDGERYAFLGTTQSQGADGPARMHVWVPGPDDHGHGTTRFAIAVEARMADLSLYYGGEGYLLYTPTALPSVGEIPGFVFERGARNDADACRGSVERHTDIPIPAGFSALTNYVIGTEFCEIMHGIGFAVAGSMPMVTPITAVPRGSIYLSGGEVTVFDEPESGMRLTQRGARLVYTPNMIQLMSEGTLTLPDLIHVASLGREGTPGGTSSLDVSVGFTFGTNFVKEHTLQAFIQKSGGPWRDAFAIPGLDVGELMLQGGVTFHRTVLKPTPYEAYPDWAFRGEVLGLPSVIEDALGIVGDEPVVIAARINKQTPIFDLQLGVTDGRPFLKPLRAVTGDNALQDAFTIDGAHLVFSPFGGTIGDRLYPWGVSLDFAMEIAGVRVGVDANADLWGAHLEADVELGAWTAAGISMTEARLGFELDGYAPLASWRVTAPRFSGGSWATDLVFGIHAGLEPKDAPPAPGPQPVSTAALTTASPSVGPVPTRAAPIQSRAAASTATTPYLRLAFSAAVRDLDLAGIATLREVELWSHRELPLSTKLSGPLASLDVGMRASVGVFGHDIAVVGAVDLDASGLRAFDLVGASEPLQVAGTAITGDGCGDVSAVLPPGLAPPDLPDSGPCVRVSVHPGELDPVVIGLTGALGVPSAGLEASFDGRLDGTGLAISLARVQLTRAITAKLTDARFYFGRAVAAGQVTDTDAAGDPVVVREGDFRLRGQAGGVLLGGFGAQLDVDLGSIRGDTWANASARLDLFDDANSPIRTSARLTGSFAKFGSDYHWELTGRGSATIAGFASSGLNFSAGERGNDHWFTLDGRIAAGPVTAELSGDLAWSSNGVSFRLVGTASMRLFGATPATATLTLSYLPSTKLVKIPGLGSALRPDRPVLSATLDFGGSIAGVIRLGGGGVLQANGDFCVNGSGRVFSVASMAKVCHLGGAWEGTIAAEVWKGMTVAASLTSMSSFRAASKLSLPTVKKNVNLTYQGVGLSGDFVVRDMRLTLGLASEPGTVCIAMKKGKCSESVTFTKAGLYVAGTAKFKVHGCIRGGGLGSKCDNWSTGVSFKANPVKFCGSKSFKLVKRWTISGCYEPPTKLYTT